MSRLFGFQFLTCQNFRTLHVPVGYFYQFRSMTEFHKNVGVVKVRIFMYKFYSSLLPLVFDKAIFLQAKKCTTTIQGSLLGTHMQFQM